MGIITYLILLALSGLIVGALARLALPGPDPMSIPATIGIGLAGSFVAGVVVLPAFRHSPGGGPVLSRAGGAFFSWVVPPSRRGAGRSARRPPGRTPPPLPHPH